MRSERKAGELLHRMEKAKAASRNQLTGPVARNDGSKTFCDPLRLGIFAGAGQKARNSSLPHGEKSRIDPCRTSVAVMGLIAIAAPRFRGRDSTG